jgi:drug/metabolite transporter (DMT)-like permease
MPDTASSSASANAPAMMGILGCLAVFASAFCFYFSTVVIRWSREAVAIDSAYFAFFRFLLGFLVVCMIMASNERGPHPNDIIC